MSRKIKFALEMAEGFEVRGLEELRDNFDLDKVIEYFADGKLLEWLKDRYYDEEAELISSLEKADEHLEEKLCQALGVDPDKYLLDPAFLERIEEKKVLLQGKTDDTEIIKNAKIVAMNQEDLADLLDLNVPLIYLCGEVFHIPIRVTGKHYIGLFDKPKVNIKATSQAELDAAGIILENVELPWGEANGKVDEPDDSNISDDIKNVEGKIWETETVVSNTGGIQAVQALYCSETARKYSSKIQISAKGKMVDAKSSLMINSLSLRKGDTMTIRAEGTDAAEAVSKLKRLIDSKFGEK